MTEHRLGRRGGEESGGGKETVGDVVVRDANGGRGGGRRRRRAGFLRVALRGQRHVEQIEQVLVVGAQEAVVLHQARRRALLRALRDERLQIEVVFKIRMIAQAAHQAQPSRVAFVRSVRGRGGRVHRQVQDLLQGIFGRHFSGVLVERERRGLYLTETVAEGLGVIGVL